jgi:site-specific recombinase XerD
MASRTIVAIGRFRRSNLADLVEEFLEVRRRVLGNRTEKTTIRAYRRDLEHFTGEFSTVVIEAITSGAIEKYLRELRTRTGAAVAPATANRHQATLSAFFGWLEDKAVITKNPMKGIHKARLPERAPGALSAETCAKLLARAQALGVREHALVQLLLATGMRISEALALNLEDIDLGRLTITVREGKGGKSRTVYVTQNERKLLRKLMAAHPSPAPFSPVFTSTRGRLSYQRAAALFKEIAAGLTNPDGSDLHLHQCRHTFATWQLAKGMNPIHLMTVTGHTDLRTLGRYTKAAKVAAAETEFRRVNQ